tara:strand:+ start:836 stop:1696 length:861 start_codon:yes stop_codon:yes gene_type:complete
MGLFDKIIDVAVPAAIGYVTGGPAGAFAAGVSADKGSQAQRKAQRYQETQITQRNQLMNEFYGIGNTNPSQGTGQFATQGRTTNAGFGSGFGNFLGDFGQNVLSPLTGLFSQVRPFISQQSVGQPALPSQTNLGGQESQQSGTNQAFIGGTGNLLGQAAKFLGSRTGQISTGVAGGIVGSMFGGQPSSMRITRKMKAQYRAVLNLNMGNYEAAADMIGVSTDMFVMVLLKRFRNDGPVVTKAALRKTKTTVRRLKSMCDMYDSLRPSATRRKTPMRRAATTLISNK